MAHEINNEEIVIVMVEDINEHDVNRIKSMLMFQTTHEVLFNEDVHPIPNTSSNREGGGTVRGLTEVGRSNG